MLILYSLFTALCLCIGFYFGFKIGRTNELPKIKIKSKEEKRQLEKEEKKNSKLEKILNNLDKYTGTSEGQEEIV